jgi:hypothetical protein
METVMNGIEKHAEYYRGYLPDDRIVIPWRSRWRRLSRFGFSSTCSAQSVRSRGLRPPNLQHISPPSSSRSPFGATNDVSGRVWPGNLLV